MKTRIPVGLALLPLVAACKPPPTDAGMDRDLPEAAPTFASEPLDSPDTEDAQWVATSDTRIVYGIPGEPAQMALECLGEGAGAAVRLTRISPADEGAGAMMAVIGNGRIGRFEVDARAIDGRFLWQGDARADDPRLESLIGDGEITATVPGAGMVIINSSLLPTELLAKCRGEEKPEPAQEATPEPDLQPET